MDVLNSLRIRTGHKGEYEHDEELQEYLNESESMVRGYLNRSDIPSECSAAVVRLAVALYYHSGAEGETSHSEGGVSLAIDPIPSDVKTMLRPYRLAKTGRSD